VLQKIVAQLPHLWQIFVLSILSTLVVINLSSDGFDAYQYYLDSQPVFAIPVECSDVYECNAIIEARD
jgi:hypothetical protein